MVSDSVDSFKKTCYYINRKNNKENIFVFRKWKQKL